MAHTIGWISIIVVLAGLASPAAAQPAADEVAKVHLETKEKLDLVLPKRIDATTMLTAVRTEGIKLTYEFIVERDKDGLPPEFEDALGKKALVIACEDEQSRRILRAGGRYGFEFRDKFDQTILSVTVSRDGCVPGISAGR